MIELSPLTGIEVDTGLDESAGLGGILANAKAGAITRQRVPPPSDKELQPTHLQ